MPGARVLSLALWSRADSEAVSLAVLPASAVSATVVEIEPASGCHDVSAGVGRYASSSSSSVSGNGAVAGVLSVDQPSAPAPTRTNRAIVTHGN